MKQFLITLTMLTTLTLTSNNLLTSNHLVSSVNKTTIENNLNYKWNDSYNWFLSNYNNYSDVYSIIKWSDYEKDWNTFATSYSTFNFDADSYLKVSTNSGKKMLNF